MGAPTYRWRPGTHCGGSPGAAPAFVVRAVCNNRDVHQHFSVALRSGFSAAVHYFFLQVQALVSAARYFALARNEFPVPVSVALFLAELQRCYLQPVNFSVFQPRWGYSYYKVQDSPSH